MNLKMDEAEIEKLSAEYEEKYGDILLEIAKVLGRMAGEKNIIGIRWFFEHLKLIELKTLKLAGVDVGESSKKVSMN